jgi:hypothetical protein
MIYYLQVTDKIEQGDLFLNVHGEWEFAQNVGEFVWAGDYGRYIRLEGSSIDYGEAFLNLLPIEISGRYLIGD